MVGHLEVVASADLLVDSRRAVATVLQPSLRAKLHWLASQVMTLVPLGHPQCILFHHVGVEWERCAVHWESSLMLES